MLGIARSRATHLPLSPVLRKGECGGQTFAWHSSGEENDIALSFGWGTDQ